MDFDGFLFIYLPTTILSFHPSSANPLLFVINAAGCSASSTWRATVYCYAYNISIADYWLRTYIIVQQYIHTCAIY